MSSIGKIFVVVNLVLSLVLLGSLSALLNASKSTAEDVAALETEVSAKQAELEQAQSEFATQSRMLDQEKNQLAGEKADLEVERDNARREAESEANDNQQLRDDLSKLTSSYELLQGDLSAAQSRNDDLASRNDDLRDAAQQAQEGARQAELARRDLEERIAGYESTIEGLNGELTVAMDRARQAERLVEVAKASGFDSTSIMAPPAIDALVAQVDQEYGFVILDKGGNDNVEKGYVFDVFRGADYLGQVRVDTVNDNYSTARILLSNGTMRAHDRATTRL